MEKRIPSLQYLCLKKIHEENPIGYRKFISQREYIFEDLDQVFDEEIKMRKDVKGSILHFFSDNSFIYGSCIREEIANVMPMVYEVYFSCYSKLERCLNSLKMNGVYNIKFIYDYIDDVWDLPNTTIADKFRHVKILISKDVDLHSGKEKTQYDQTHPISFIIKFTSHTYETVLSETSILETIGCVFDVDQLMYVEDSCPKPKVELNKSLKELQNQIYRKEYKLFCKSDCFLSESSTQDCFWRHNYDVCIMIEKMKKNGWTCINQPCSDPYCIMAPEDIALAQEEKDSMIRCLDNYRSWKRSESSEISDMDKVLMKYELPESASNPKLFWRKCYDKTKYATKIRKARKLFYKVIKKGGKLCMY